MQISEYAEIPREFNVFPPCIDYFLKIPPQRHLLKLLLPMPERIIIRLSITFYFRPASPFPKFIPSFILNHNIVVDFFTSREYYKNNTNYAMCIYTRWDKIHVFDKIKFIEKYHIDEAGYGGHVECNERILLNVLLDYWADIFRLKDLHYFYFSTNACFRGKRISLQLKAKNNFALILRWLFITSNIGNVTLRLLN